jgi:NodT family efflux transporter outer membrane factor (OMF) lipoprotein
MAAEAGIPLRPPSAVGKIPSWAGMTGAVGRPAGGLRPFLAGLALLALLAGCAAVGPDYVKPERPLPDSWHSLFAGAGDQSTPELARWWQTLGDPQLSDLVQQAADANLDAREALSRVRQARYQRHRSRAALFPTLDASASGKKSGRRESGGPGTETELYSAGFDAGWELDVFGGARRGLEAAQADLEARVEDFRDVMVTLLAEVAVNYSDLRTAQARLAVARRNLASLEETLRLVDTLTQTGLDDELALAQARYNLESARARLPALEVSREAALNRLAVLTAQAPGALHQDLLDVRPLPTVGGDLAVGVPADALRQRPDIRRAERELAAQTARIGEAQADLYPKFSLSGSIGLEALALGDLFSSPTRLWSLGPVVSWPIFDAGAIRSNIGVQTELRQQAALRYEAAVLGALEDVENALTALAREQEKGSTLRAAAAAARQAAELAEQQYIAGLADFNAVLDAQRSLLSFEDQMTESRGAVVSDLIQLYKALGGGWQSMDPEALAANAQTEGEPHAKR